MNRSIKKLLELLTDIPTYSTENNSSKLLKSMINSGEFKPKVTINFQQENNIDSDLATTLIETVIGQHFKETIENYEIIRELDYTVYGVVHEDYYTWVNFFICVSEDGKEYVLGDLEDTVYASSKRFYNKFISENKYEVWDYGDI